jgi:anion-transporting  ArsA/GET3 family ATPase
VRTLIVEVAGEDRLSGLFDTAGVVHGRETELAPGLYGISIDAERATEEYLASQLRVRPLVELLTRSRAFHTFAAAAPGLAELVTLGKIWSLAIALRPAEAADGGEARQEPVWGAIVVDCPATGHGVALLETAGNVEELAAGGPVRDQAARIHEVVSHPAATGITLVARPEELSVTEAVEAAGMLRARGLPVAAAVLNGVRDERFSDVDAPALETAAAGPPGTEREAVAAALAHLARQRSDAGYRERLGAGTGLPVLELPEIVQRRFDLAALERLAAALGESIGARNGQP